MGRIPQLGTPGRYIAVFQANAVSLVTGKRNGQVENRQLREHLAQALARLEQVQHENLVLHQLDLNLHTEVASLRFLVFNPDPQAAAAIRPPGL
ncbi:hypothetical protein H310_03828 [Aphanomyces invadans]|uniref:Uncharacterized protein n=1 Tax=Aphanomyces invadans TaxID=157072 RepID=A0A024UFG4_9STRA|nr:hypothetical protein H310_03828 [Aphanomyces invadans]ETW04637.1 hypothetical protein H310_03828 [Aphanomyces invadans]|eukprot:XP_008866075.1 hypothetical protein H310_03828 [Aphanomyces invadans]